MNKMESSFNKLFKKKNKKNTNTKNIYILFGMIAIVVITAVVLVLFFTTFKEKKYKLSVDDVTYKSRNLEYVVVDVKGSYLKQEYITKAIEITGPGEWKVEFFELEDEEKAKTLFTYNKSYYQLAKQDNDTEYHEAYNDYEFYSLTTETSYVRLCRIGNTMIYAFVDVIYRDAVRKFTFDLGY